MDYITLIKDYGPFVALVVFVMFEGSKREDKYRDRENTFIEETRKREAKYIEREDKYIEVIEGLSDSFKKLSEDVSDIKEKLGEKA